MPGKTRQPGEQLFAAACHNAGHVLACLATGQNVPPLTILPCRQEYLGPQQVQDSTVWSLICWAGPAAEAIAASQTGAADETVAAWMWSRYRRAAPPGAIPCQCTPTVVADPAVLPVAMAIAGANWLDIERLAYALTETHRSGEFPAQRLGPPEILIRIDNRQGADIGTPFDRWQQAIIAAKDSFVPKPLFQLYRSQQPGAARW